MLVFFNKFLLKWEVKSRRLSNSSWKFEFSVFSGNNVFFSLEMVIFTTLFWLTLWNSTSNGTMLFRGCLTLFTSTLKFTTLIRCCSTLEIPKFKYATLLQRWFDDLTSRCHINQKTTLKKLSNVCWVCWW